MLSLNALWMHSLWVVLLQSVYTMASDIWSAGALVYELCMLMPPYNCASMDELVKMKSSMQTLTAIPVTRY